MEAQGVGLILKMARFPSAFRVSTAIYRLRSHNFQEAYETVEGKTFETSKNSEASDTLLCGTGQRLMLR